MQYSIIWLEINFFFWTRWMSYGLCFLVGWMWNHSWEVYEENQIMKMLWRWSWRNVKMNMDAKAEVLSVISQVRWRISKINNEVFHGKFWGNEYRTQLITFNAIKRTSLQSSRERSYRLRMEKTYSKSRRMIVILLWISY